MKAIFYLSLGLTVLLSACKTSKMAVSVSGLEGEWSMVELKGANIGEDSSRPTVTFKIADKRVAAYAGCNRISGSFEATDRSKAISFREVVATRMFCIDMSREEAMIKAINEAKSFEPAGKDSQSYIFNDGDGRKLFVIEKKK